MKKVIALAVIIGVSTVFSGCQSLLQVKAKSGLQVITDGVPSSVFIDGQYLNSTPLIEKNLKPGQYTIKIQPNDPSLVSHETIVTLRKSLLTVITWKPAERPELSGGVIYEMEPLADKSKSEVSVTTVPDGAIVSLEGKEKDFSPVVFSDVQPGNRAIEVTLPSYETQSHTLNVQPGFRMLVTVKLAKLQAIEENPEVTESAPATQSATLPIEGIASESAQGASKSGTVETNFSKLLN